MNVTLKHALEEAEFAVQHDPCHQLSLGRRHQIYSALGARADTKDGPHSIGHMRRALLARAVVRFVLPTWEKKRPEDRTVQELLVTMDQLIDGNISIQQINNQWRDVDYYMDTLLYEAIEAKETDQTEIMVGLAAVRALDVIIRDDIFDADHIDVNLSNGQVVFHNRDTPFFALAAYVNPYLVELGQKDIYSAKEYDFWMWWLKEAVPDAWKATL